jgi:hypothetical protein
VVAAETNPSLINRRTFLKQGAGALIAAKTASALAAPSSTEAPPQFKTSNARWQAAYDDALAVLANNVQQMPRYNKPVLIEGSVYQGIWMECGPHESLVYRKFRPDVTRNSHMTFFELQRPDGQFPANNKATEAGFGQIQMVVPIAATAWEFAQATNDEEFLHTAYRLRSLVRSSLHRWEGFSFSLLPLTLKIREMPAFKRASITRPERSRSAGSFRERSSSSVTACF